MKLTLHTDGGSRGNPGPAAAALVLRDTDSGAVQFRGAFFLGQTTNNVAEYEGLLRGLKLARALHAAAVHIRSDSQLMVRQVNGEYRVKSGPLIALHRQVLHELAGIPQWSCQHVYRNQNTEADELANVCMDRGADVIEVDASGTYAPTTGASAARPTPTTSSPAASTDAKGWRVQVLQAGAKCPAQMVARKTYVFNAAVPGGFCCHAAGVLFREVGPDLAPPAEATELTCSHCRAKLEVRPG